MNDCQSIGRGPQGILARIALLLAFWPWTVRVLADNGDAPSTQAQSAASFNSSRYVLALELVGARSQLARTPDRGQFGTGALIDGQRDGTFSAPAEVDTSAGIGFRLERRRARHSLGVTAHWHFPVGLGHQRPHAIPPNDHEYLHKY